MALKRAAPLGVLSWAIPFAVGFLAFPLKQMEPALFNVLINFSVLNPAAALLQRYFRDRAVSVREAVLVAGFGSRSIWLWITRCSPSGQ